MNDLEESLKKAIEEQQYNAYTPPPRKPMSTDPIPPKHHDDLINHTVNMIDYVSHELERHRELMNIIEELKSELDGYHTALMKSGNKVKEIKPELSDVKAPWFKFKKAHIIEAVLLIFVIIAGLSTYYYKFL